MYYQNYFMASTPNIANNSQIRTPQIEAYHELLKYYKNDYTNRNTLLVLPTGVGKTGLICIAPFGLCEKRMLIITPGTVIRDSILSNLTSTNPDSFWYKADIFQYGEYTPIIVEYDKNINRSVMDKSNIVVVNIHKTQESSSNSLLNQVPKDYFDLIIIDEAHHSAANTWIDCVNYFETAKVIKLTGTPFRSDGKDLNAELIYEYSLGRAMAKEYIKSLENITYVPGEIKFTIDDSPQEYTIEQLYELNIKDAEWVSRSVAYSIDCSEKVVDQSIKILTEKYQHSETPHKIIAVACSVKHAEMIKQIYEKKNIPTTIIHSNLTNEEKIKAFSDIENHRVMAVINVIMLGEGYDHKYLSVAAIFRPFRTEMPYMQFVGRVLRKIESDNPKDNIAYVVSHKHLELDKLWEKYKREIDRSDIIKNLCKYDEIINTSSDGDGTVRFSDIGGVKEAGEAFVVSDAYLNTALIEKSKQLDAERANKVKELMTLLGIGEIEAQSVINRTNKISFDNRPDILYRTRRADIAKTVKEKVVPDLLVKHGISKDENSLATLDIFADNKYHWIIQKNNVKNDAMLAIFINTALKLKLGKREDWTDNDYIIAFDYLDQLTSMLNGVLSKK